MSENIQESLKRGRFKKNYFILNMLKSKYCLAVLGAGLAGGYYFVPEKIFNGLWFWIGIIYIIIVSLAVQFLALYYMNCFKKCLADKTVIA